MYKLDNNTAKELSNELWVKYQAATKERQQAYEALSKAYEGTKEELEAARKAFHAAARNENEIRKMWKRAFKQVRLTW